MKKKFIIIDDDPVNNFICTEVINFAINDANIVTFTDPQEGLDFITSRYSGASPETEQVVCFLDINMPLMTGWDFLEKFDTLDETVKKRFEVFVLSSSIDPRDREQASTNRYVKDIVVKPLTQEFLEEISAA